MTSAAVIARLCELLSTAAEIIRTQNEIVTRFCGCENKTIDEVLEEIDSYVG